MRLLRSAGFLAPVLIVHMVSGCGVGEDFNNARIRGENIFSMIAITNVAVALERYGGEHGEYPTAGSMADLRPLLETYLGQERGIDRWGEELIVDVSPDGYVLSSKGNDKVGGHEEGGAVDTMGHSISMTDGRFVQYHTSVTYVVPEHEGRVADARETG